MKRLTLVFAFIAVLILAAVIFLPGCKKSSTSSNNTANDTWTVMVYGAGNNNLDTLNNSTSYIIQDVQDMEKVGSQPGLNIIAMVSSFHTGGIAKYYHIDYKPNDNVGQLTSQMLADKGTKDMSDGATLKEFLNFCKANYPATRYLLVIDDHGGGWRGTCSDELNGGGGLLEMAELKNAIATSDLQHVDIVTFHACLMAMVEVAYEIRNVASYMTACQFTMPMENVMGADLWLAWLKDNLNSAPADVAHKIAEKVMERAQFKQKTTHYAMIDLSQIETLGSKVGHFGTTLIANSGQYWNEVVDAWGRTHTTQYDEPTFVDLREFANHIMNDETNLHANNLIRTGAQDLISAVNAAVPYTAMWPQPPDVSVPRGGLNIYLPYTAAQYNSDSVKYRQLDFDGTNWHSFINNFTPNTNQGPNGRCCYNNNADCQDITQNACNQLTGTWTQGISCAGTPCQQGGNCSTICNQPTALTLGVVAQCQFTGTDSLDWYVINLGVGTYRFQLCGFTYPAADYDLYVFGTCNDANPMAYSYNYGCEDTLWSVAQAGQFLILVYRSTGSGAYQLLISQQGPNLSAVPMIPSERSDDVTRRSASAVKPRPNF